MSIDSENYLFMSLLQKVARFLIINNVISLNLLRKHALVWIIFGNFTAGNRNQSTIRKMFKKTKSPELTLFESPSNLMRGRAQKKYDDPRAWQNQFYELVYNNIDEDAFTPLFKANGMGRPNASIRRLVAIMIMKEGNRRSDEQMFEAVDFDLLVRKALGLVNISDQAPSLDTYYLLRRRIVEYEDRTGINLMERCFKDVTKIQSVTFNVEGKSIRMDSKLIGSNIAKYSRYRIILTTLQQWAKENFDSLNHSLRTKLKSYLDEDAQKTEYRSTSEDMQQRLEALGILIYEILTFIRAKENLLLYRVFHEQYDFADGKVILRDKKQVSAQSVQNPNDPDAHYRSKGDQHVKGYSVNATETNDDDSPHIITDVQVKPASAADNDFLQDGFIASEEITGNYAENINADGAYQSDDNRDFAADNLIDFVTSGLQGKQPRYDLSLNDGNLTVVDKQTGETIPVERVKDKWRISTGGKVKYRYFSQEQVEKALLRKKLESIPKKELDRRNNVEAAMFQISFHTRNNKTRYRGLFKHIMWAYSRCLWMNFIRLMIFQTTTCQRTLFGFCKPILKRLQDLMMQIREILFATDSIFIGRYKAAYILLVYMTD